MNTEASPIWRMLQDKKRLLVLTSVFTCSLIFSSCFGACRQEEVQIVPTPTPKASINLLDGCTGEGCGIGNNENTLDLDQKCQDFLSYSSGGDRCDANLTINNN